MYQLPGDVLFLLALFSNYVSKCSSMGLDVILVDLKEPCSYFNASAFVPFFLLLFLGNGSLIVVCSCKRMLVSLHKHYGHSYQHKYCM